MLGRKSSQVGKKLWTKAEEMQGRLEPTTLARAFNSLIAGDRVKVVPCSALHTCLTGTWRSGGSGRSHRPRRCCTRTVSKQKGYDSTRRPTPAQSPRSPLAGRCVTCALQLSRESPLWLSAARKRLGGILGDTLPLLLKLRRVNARSVS